MTRVVEPITAGCADALRDYLSGLPYLSVDWDTSRPHSQRVDLEMRALEASLEDGDAWMTWSEGKIDGLITLRALDWDSAHFGESMGMVDFCRAESEESASVLLHQLGISAQRRGIKHLRHVVDVREAGLIHRLQSSGWRYIWACIRQVCDTSTVNHPPFSVSLPEVEVVETTREHLPDLLSISEILPPYSWPDFDRSLGEAGRESYARTRLKNCVETDFADLCLTLTHRGKAIGFNASKIQYQPTSVPGPVAYSVERDLFISPETIPGLGPVFQKEVVRRLSEKVRFLIGQVRLDGTSMAHTVQAAGFRSWGGSLYMALRP